jgi:phosphohistidine phosphatase
MKRDLILIRHTKSSWSDLSLSDFDRPLKKDRIGDAKRMAAKLKELELAPDLIICSPALRTRQTAEIFCKKLGYPFKKVQFDKRLYETTEMELLQVIRETDEAIETLMVVGHNPSITNFTNLFSKVSIAEVPTTGVVWLEFKNNDWEIYRSTPSRIKYFLTPKTI